MRNTIPDAPRGLYDPAYEHDACGVGADARTSDGAEILTQVPARFLGAVSPALADRSPPRPGDLAVGMTFLPRDDAPGAARCRALVEEAVARQGLPLLAWRDVPLALEVLCDQS